MEIILDSVVVGATIIILVLIARTLVLLVLNADIKILKIVTSRGGFAIKFNPKDSNDKAQIENLLTSLKKQLETDSASYFCQTIITICDKQYLMFNLYDFKYVETTDS